MKHFVWLGREVYVPLGMVILVAAVDEPAVQERARTAADQGRLLDLSGDEEPAAAVLLKDGSVVVTALEAHQVVMSFEEE